MLMNDDKIECNNRIPPFPLFFPLILRGPFKNPGKRMNYVIDEKENKNGNLG